MSKGNTPLHHAARFGHDDVVKLLLEKVTDKMPRDGTGRTPLHDAARMGRVEVTRTLLDAIDTIPYKGEISSPEVGQFSFRF